MRTQRQRTGEYKERIAIWNTTTTSDNIGGKTESTPAAALGYCWAKVIPMTGTRALDFAQITGFQGYTFTIPYRSDITIDTTRKIVYSGRTFQIQSVLPPDEARKELIILAYEKK